MKIENNEEKKIKKYLKRNQFSLMRACTHSTVHRGLTLTIDWKMLLTTNHFLHHLC